MEEIWRTTEPFCLLDDPIKKLRLLREMFPDEDLRPHSAAIAMWWDERDYPPKGRKRKPSERWTISGISAGIRGWIARAIKERNAPSKPSQYNLFNGGRSALPEGQDYMTYAEENSIENVRARQAAEEERRRRDGDR